MSLPVITISREYAAGGHMIAAELSEQLGIPFYDRDFVRRTAEDSGYAEEDIEREGERMSPGGRLLNTFLSGAVSYNSSYDGIYEAQKKVILSLAASPCIIVGRCADHILQEAGIPAFNIYLYADKPFRLQYAAKVRAEEGVKMTERELDRYIDRQDMLRSTYYRQYTGADMGSCRNYDICLNVGAIGPERCVDVLMEILLPCR